MTTSDGPAPVDWTRQLVTQIDGHWTGHLRPRLEGITDEEYTWEPVPGAWNVRRRHDSGAPIQGGTGEYVVEFALPEPVPAPVTTIAWRLAHLIVGVLAMRNGAHFDAPPAHYMTWDYAGTADGALAQLDAAYATWLAGVRGLDTEALACPCGEIGPYAAEPMVALVLHIHRELIHHGAEIALLRDLYAHRAG